MNDDFLPCLGDISGDFSGSIYDIDFLKLLNLNITIDTSRALKHIISTIEAKYARNS